MNGSRATRFFRLIMNLTPLNGIAESVKGDVETLPMWSMMTPIYVGPEMSMLVVSSEDVRCFFYTMSVPVCWWKYLAFNRKVPDSCLPRGSLQGQSVYMVAKVLPMGFVNSVSLAQHVHRNLALWSASRRRRWDGRAEPSRGGDPQGSGDHGGQPLMAHLPGQLRPLGEGQGGGPQPNGGAIGTSCPGFTSAVMSCGS